jgi:hypothetical protein
MLPCCLKDVVSDVSLSTPGHCLFSSVFQVSDFLGFSTEIAYKIKTHNLLSGNRAGIFVGLFTSLFCIRTLSITKSTGQQETY